MLNRHRLVGQSAVGFLIAFGCLAGILLLPARARAEDTAAAREHYQKGTAFYDLGRYQDAAKEFEAAYEAKNDPALLYNLAQSHRLAGNTEQALHFYRTYLRRVPKAANRSEIEERIMALEKLLDVKKGTQVPPNQTIPPAVAGTPPTGDTTPPPPSAPVSTPPATTPSPPAPPPPGPIGMQPPPPMTPPPPSPAADPGAGKRTLGLVASGVGVVGIVAAIIFGQGAKSAAKEITDAGNSGKAFTQALQDVESRGKRDQTLEFVSLGIGVAALAAGAYLYWSGSSATEAPRSGVAVSPSFRFLPGLTSASLQVTF
jgi:tetratricopeptide (TPR) repeat protein